MTSRMNHFGQEHAIVPTAASRAVRLSLISRCGHVMGSTPAARFRRSMAAAFAAFVVRKSSVYSIPRLKSRSDLLTRPRPDWFRITNCGSSGERIGWSQFRTPISLWKIEPVFPVMVLKPMRARAAGCLSGKFFPQHLQLQPAFLRSGAVGLGRRQALQGGGESFRIGAVQFRIR